MNIFRGALLLFTLACSYPSAHSQAGCQNVICPAEVECNPPRARVILSDPENGDCCNITECVCEGTNSRLRAFHNSESLKELYENCTIINGNLEIVNVRLEEDFNVIDITKNIRTVTGYVLISNVIVRYVDLSSLRLIKGDDLYVDEITSAEACLKVPIDSSSGFALYVSNNYQPWHAGQGLIEIHMPHLTEISRGKVKIVGNRHLCFVDTIVFSEEILVSDDQTAHIRENNESCSSCPPSCVDKRINEDGHCWGESESLCQQFTKIPCTVCPNRCNKQGRCCDSYCNAGCSGTGECYACKAYNNFGKCVQMCSSQADAKYALLGFCVRECPATRRTFEPSRRCVLSCPYNYYSEGGFCKECPRGGCSHVCYGLETGYGPLKNDHTITADNIGHFNKNCTVIEGSLIFTRLTFRGDSYCGISPLRNMDALRVFENVEEITGYLSIEYWQHEDLCFFKNLKRIRGLKRLNNAYSLNVQTHTVALRQLCFNSLKEIEHGSVAIVANSHLCHADGVDWSLFMKNEMKIKIDGNKRSGLCTPCHSNCNPDHGCWGPGSDQCGTCKFFTDYTNSSGIFIEEWIFDAEKGKTVPGYNVTNCVEECDTTKGVYPTADRKCFPCDPQCQTCTGPGPTNCTAISSTIAQATDVIRKCRNCSDCSKKETIAKVIACILFRLFEDSTDT